MEESVIHQFYCLKKKGREAKIEEKEEFLALLVFIMSGTPKGTFMSWASYNYNSVMSIYESFKELLESEGREEWCLIGTTLKALQKIAMSMKRADVV